MPYAVNIPDWLTYKDDLGLQILLAPVADERTVIKVDKKRMDEIAIPLECDEERAAAIVEIVRKRFKKHELRCYRSKTGKGGWKRV